MGYLIDAALLWSFASVIGMLIWYILKQGDPPDGSI